MSDNLAAADLGRLEGKCICGDLCCSENALHVHVPTIWHLQSLFSKRSSRSIMTEVLPYELDTIVSGCSG